MSTDLYFVRHGQVAPNRLYRLCGNIDPPLTRIGRRQALDCSETIDNLPRIDAIYCSPLTRASQTAVLATSYAFGMPSIIYDDRLRERGFGPLEGAFAPLKAKRIWSYDCSFTKSNYGEETIYDFELRTESFLEMLRANHPNQRVLVFSHGGVGAAIHALLDENNPYRGNYFKNFHMKNGDLVYFLL